MRIIPVMDLKAGLAVHAVRGERDRYRPAAGLLVADGNASALLAAYREQLGLQEVYIADLDAIQRRGDQRELVAALAGEQGTAIMLDAGLATARQALEVLAWGPAKVVAGSETLASWAELRSMARTLRAGQLVFSLDMRGSQVLASAPELAALAPLDALARARDAGCREAILLDLARVGASAGPDCALIAAAHGRFPQLDLIAGGGVRDSADLWELRAAGAAGALLATALHDGRIGRADVERLAHQAARAT